MVVSRDVLPISPELAPVTPFCERHGILAHAQTAFDLVRQFFPPPAVLAVRLETDPETDDESLVIHVTTQDEVNHFVEVFDRCKTQWVQSIPSQALALIHLSLAVS
jgi:hypothetical protein